MEFDFSKLKNNEKIQFEKEVNIYQIIDRIKSLNYVSPHKFFKTFLEKNLNESAIILSIKMFYEGILKEQSGDWVKIDYKISNMQNMKELKIIFEVKKLYNKQIIFETQEQRDNLIKSESDELRIILTNIIKELAEEMPFIELIDILFEKTITDTFNKIVESNLDNENKKLKIPLEELNTKLLIEIWGNESIIVKENMYMDYEDEDSI